MPLSVSETTKELKLDLPEDMPDEIADDIKADVGQFIVDATLENVGAGKSPVSGYGAFKQLSREYADEQKGGRRLPNLDLEGDMLNAFTYRITKEGVVTGIWGAEAEKSFGHNSGFKGHPVLEGVAPMRRFIPDEDETYRRDIMSGIDRIVDERVNEWRSGQTRSTPNRADVETSIDDRSSREIQEDFDSGTRVSLSLGESALTKLVRGILKRDGA